MLAARRLGGVSKGAGNIVILQPAWIGWYKKKWATSRAHPTTATTVRGGFGNVATTPPG